MRPRRQLGQRAARTCDRGRRARWGGRVSRVARWLQRNGLHMPRVGWPGLIHQAWGWYDGLSSSRAAIWVIAAIMFLVATAIYLVGASAWVSANRVSTQ